MADYGAIGKWLEQGRNVDMAAGLWHRRAICGVRGGQGGQPPEAMAEPRVKGGLDRRAVARRPGPLPDWLVMQAGFVLPGGPIREQVELAVAAENAGWDAVFVWEGAYHPDAWCLLAAVAARTTRIKLGTMLTPLPWRRPWEVAAEAATVDQLSGGRAIVTVGLGAAETGRAVASDPLDRATRAGLLDEGLEIIERLWRGETDFAGGHYVLDMAGEPSRDLRPMQQPRIPIWVVGAWRRGRSMRRAVGYDGVVPHVMDHDAGGFVSAFEDMVRWVREHRREDGTTAEIIWEGETPADNPEEATAKVTRWHNRGATWWLESRWGPDRSDIRARIEAGPPRPSPT